MAYTKKTLAEQKETVKENITTALGLEIALIPEASMIDALASGMAAGQVSQYSELEYLTSQAIPSLADEPGIRSWGVVKGVQWVTSSIAVGTTEATGKDGAIIGAGAILTIGDNTYINTSSATIVSGSAILAIQSEEGGLDKNVDSGTSMTFVSTPDEVDSNTTVGSDGLVGGSDTWTYEQYRTAVLQTFSEPARGGNDTDYEHWTRESSDASEVWVYGYSTHPSFIEKGDVEVYFLIDSYEDGIPSETERDIVKAYIDTVRPMGMGDLTCPPIISSDIYYSIEVLPYTTTIQDNVLASLEALHASTAPGGIITTGQMNRAISDSEGVTDFTLIAVGTVYPATEYPQNQKGTTRASLLTVGSIDWS